MEFAVKLPLSSCKGLPLVRSGGTESGQLISWTNAALLSILREAIYDPSPDAEAQIERWYSLRLALRGLNIANPED